jgi:hypothetical protein
MSARVEELVLDLGTLEKGSCNICGWRILRLAVGGRGEWRHVSRYADGHRAIPMKAPLKANEEERA